MAEQHSTNPDSTISSELLAKVKQVIVSHLESNHSATFVQLARLLREQKHAGKLVITSQQVKAVIEHFEANGMIMRAGNGFILPARESSDEEKLQQFVIVHGVKYYVNENRLFLDHLEINSIDEIEGLDNIQNLKDLSLNENCLESITKLANLPISSTLQAIALHDNQIISLDGIKECHELKILGMGKNRLENLDGINGLNQLTDVIVNDNCLESLEPLKNCTNLKEIDASNNKITKIEGLGKLEHLIILNLSNNAIEVVTREDVPWGKKTNLAKVDLSHNRIKSASIDSVSELVLSCNNLVQIVIADRATFDYLYLDNNALTDTTFLKEYKNYQTELDLTHNPITSLAGMEYRLRAGIDQVMFDVNNIPSQEWERLKALDDTVLLNDWEDTQEHYRQLRNKNAQE